jgi:hypothetical protein
METINEVNRAKDRKRKTDIPRSANEGGLRRPIKEKIRVVTDFDRAELHYIH